MTTPDRDSNDWKARLGGLGLVAAAALLLKIGVLDVLRQAEAHADSVSTSMKAVLVAPMFGILGLVLLVVGAPGDGSTGVGRHFVNAGDRRLKPLGWALAVAALVPGVVLWAWLSARLRELGYGD